MKQFLFALGLFVSTVSMAQGGFTAGTVNTPQNPYQYDGCYKQKNVPAQFSDDEKIVVIPSRQVMLTPPTYETVTERITVQDEASEEYYTCDADGTFKKCTRTIPAKYENINYSVETKPATYQTYPAEIKRIRVKKLIRPGYIAIVPCTQQ